MNTKLTDWSNTYHVYIDGIPAIAKVTACVPGGANPATATTPEDIHGLLEWELYDRKGYHAPWLERKVEDLDLSDDVEEQIRYKSETCIN